VNSSQSWAFSSCQFQFWIKHAVTAQLSKAIIANAAEANPS